jgi:hypothetical protein
VNHKRLSWYLVVVMVLTSGMPMIGLQASSGASGTAAAARILSPQDLYDSLNAANGRLFLVGPDSLVEPGSGLWLLQKGAASCHSAVVNPTTLALGDLRTASCEDPALYGETVLAVNDVENGGPQDSTVRIAHVANNAAGFVVGPVVMSYQETSDTDAVWTYGGGYLWIYDSATKSGAELLQVSQTTGAVVNAVAMPNISRPLLAANDAGLWLAPASNSLGSSPPGIYLHRPGKPSATLVAAMARPFLGWASWLLATPENTYADVLGGATSLSLWRFNATGTRESDVKMPTRANEINNGEFGYGAASYVALGSEVATVAPEYQPRKGSEVTSVPQGVFVLDPSSGKVSLVAADRPPASYASLYAQPAVEAVGDAVIFLDPPNGGSGATQGFSALYRVLVPKSS